MNRLETFSPNALQPFISCLAKRGIPAERYLKQHHIPVELISSDGGKIFKRQAYGFFRDVAEHEGLASYGFLDGDPYSIGDLGMLGQATLQSSTLKDGVQTFARLLATVSEGNHVWLQEGPNLSWLCCKTYDLRRTDYVPDHTSILVLRELVRLVAGPNWQPPFVHFYTEPVIEVEQFLGRDDTRIEFLQNLTGLALPTEMLTRRLDQCLGQALIQQTTKAQLTTTRDKVEAVIASLFKNHYRPSADQLSEMLGMSRITLYRMLAKEGTSYRQLIDRIRFNMAAALLENVDLSINEIAQELGYSTTGNFIRAFHRLSGFTPSNYRKLMK